MRVSGGFGLALLFSAAAFGQGYHSYFNPQPRIQGGFGNVVYPGGTSATNPAIQRGFGNVAFPGGGGPRLNVPFSSQGPTPLLPAFGVANLGPSVGQGRSSRRSSSVYAVPVYVGGYGYGYGSGYGSGYGGYDNPYPPDATAGAPPPQQPNVVVVYPQAPQPPAGDRSVVYGPPPQAGLAQPYEDQAAGPEAPHFLIAFKDHTIYSAIAYWVDGDTLHYFTSGNTHNQVSLSLVDRDLTERLNRESGTDLRLPR
jgi:hypothetical protein